MVPVADPGFLTRETNPQGGDANLLFGQNVPENCMKMKEIGPGEEHVPGVPLDPPLCVHLVLNNQIIKLNSMMSVLCFRKVIEVKLVFQIINF